jgi:streptomycin 6-kinase
VSLDDLGDLAATDLAAAASPAGRSWLAALPAMVAELARLWHFAADDDVVRHGYHAVVVPVRRDGRALALKLIWPPDQASGEAAALIAWRARGSVELVNADLAHGALLLERLDPARSLAGLPLAEAAGIAGALIRRLAIEAPPRFPAQQASAPELAATLQERQLAVNSPLPSDWVALATRLAASLADDPARLLVHTDLHYDNILASERPGEPWVAIDPKAAVGNPARSAAELLWTRVDELPGPQAILGVLDTIVASGQLDHAAAAAWGFVRAIDYWLWAVANGLTTDRGRCERVASALASIVG